VGYEAPLRVGDSHKQRHDFGAGLEGWLLRDERGRQSADEYQGDERPWMEIPGGHAPSLPHSWVSSTGVWASSGRVKQTPGGTAEHSASVPHGYFSNEGCQPIRDDLTGPPGRRYTGLPILRLSLIFEASA